MPHWTNSAQRYGLLAVLLHWGMALLLVALVALGLFMLSLPDAGYNVTKITLIFVHKSLGMIALAIVVARIAWRALNPLPAFAPDLPAWQQLTARVVHLCFYALMLSLPITGWLMSSAGGYPVPIFGWFNLPNLIGVDQRLFDALVHWHRWLSDGLIVLVALHGAAALHHHFLRRDDTLLKMLP